MESQGTLKENDIDTIGNQKALKILESTCNKTPSGHYETGLLWINDQCLPNNRRLAEFHLQGLQRKLANDVGLLDRYDAEIQKDLKVGYIHKISALEDLDTKWYLPHYGITNPNKPGKLRCITNAASCYAGTCLNDKLLVGLDLLGNMLAIQLRFREPHVALQSDIEAMFMQVKVRTEDRQFLRFLWTQEISSVSDVFDNERHIFGPVILQHAQTKPSASVPKTSRKNIPTPSNKYVRTSRWMITLHRSTL